MSKVVREVVLEIEGNLTAKEIRNNSLYEGDDGVLRHPDEEERRLALKRKTSNHPPPPAASSSSSSRGLVQKKVELPFESIETLRLCYDAVKKTTGGKNKNNKSGVLSKDLEKLLEDLFKTAANAAGVVNNAAPPSGSSALTSPLVSVGASQQETTTAAASQDANNATHVSVDGSTGGATTIQQQDAAAIDAATNGVQPSTNF